MSEISNIDAIIELIMREARARKETSLIQGTYTVQVLIDERLKEIRDSLRQEEMSKAEFKRQAAWNKGM